MRRVVIETIDGRAIRAWDQMPIRVDRDLNARVPVGSEPGEYEVQVLDAELLARASAKGVATIRDFVTTLKASLDLIALPPGGYRLAVRRQGADWRLFPATLR